MSARGRGFALYAIGISVWMTFVSACGTTYMLPLIADPAGVDCFVISQQLVYIAVFFLAALLDVRMGPLSQIAAERVQAAAFVVMTVCAIAACVVPLATPLLIVYGASLGLGVATGFLQWIRILSVRPSRDIVALLFISSLASVASGAVICFIDASARLAILCALSLVSVVFIHVNRLAVADELQCLLAQEHRADLREVVRELWPSGICAVILTLVAPIASAFYVDAAGQDLFRTLLAQAANLVALAILALVIVAAHKDVSMVQAYCVMLPLLATSVLASAFLSPEHRWLVLFFGDMCFCVVSFLLVVTSCDVSRRLSVSTTVTYGLLGGAIYLARLPEAMLVIEPTAHLDSPTPFAIAVLLLYLLTIPAAVLLYMRQRTAAAELKIAEPHETTLEEACAALADRAEIPERQAEVLALMAKGDTTQRIAETLCLSESTVRTYRKSIYAALGVHSRQELLDTVHAAMHEPRESRQQ